MELVLIYVAFGIVSSLFVAMCLDIAAQNKAEKREREIIKSIITREEYR